MKKLAAIGDSFSTTKYGRSWPDFVRERLQSQLIRACSAGAGMHSMWKSVTTL